MMKTPSKNTFEISKTAVGSTLSTGSYSHRPLPWPLHLRLHTNLTFVESHKAALRQLVQHFWPQSSNFDSSQCPRCPYAARPSIIYSQIIIGQKADKLQVLIIRRPKQVGEGLQNLNYN